MDIFEISGSWLIVVGIHSIGGDGITGTRSQSSRTRLTFERCWTGDEWSTHHFRGLKFESREEADEYLVKNASQLHATL